MSVAGRQIAAFFADRDILVAPMLPRPADPLGEVDMMTDDAAAFGEQLSHLRCFMRPFNVAGGPAASTPVHWTPDELPFGARFAADFGREDLLFRQAAQLEHSRPWIATGRHVS